MARSVGSLQNQTLSDFECFIVDNGSTDGSLENLPQLDDRFDIIRAGENLGFAAGNNLAAQKARAPWMALLNPDAFARPDWLEKLLAATELAPHVTMVGSTQFMALDPGVYDGFGDCYHVTGLAWRSLCDYRIGSGDIPPVIETCEVFAPCAAAALYDRETFIRLGGFDERFFCYHEDVDLAFRMRLDGGICVQSKEAIVDHVSSGISGRASDFAVYHGTRNRIWTFFKNMPTGGVLLFLGPHLLLNLALLVWSAFRPGRWRPTSRGIWHGFKGLPAVLKDRHTLQSRRKIGLGEFLGFAGTNSIITISPLKVLTRAVHSRPLPPQNASKRDL